MNAALPRIEAETGTTIHVRSGSPLRAASAVVALPTPRGRAGGADVKYRVLRGAAVLGAARANEITVKADDQGRASADLLMTSRGAALVAATVEGDGDPLVFHVRTEGVTDRLDVRSEASLTADSGQIIVDISASDHLGRPVERARLTAEVRPLGDEASAAKVTEKGKGLYRAVAKTRRAGTWTITVGCPDTGVFVDHVVTVTPAKPARIEMVGGLDPRLEPPFNEVVVRAKLLDRHGNRLDPTMLSAKGAGRPLASWMVADEAWFLLKYNGYGDVKVEVAAKGTRLRHRATVHFAASWFDVPKVVRPGAQYSMPIYLIPVAGRQVKEARVELEFNPETVSFGGFIPADGVDATAAPGPGDKMVAISVRTKTPMSSSRTPEGMMIGRVSWSCKGAGEACFISRAAMSPLSRRWIRCTQQKLDNPLCICVNLIYRLGADNQRIVARQAYRQFVRVVWSNEYSCCPYIHVREDICTLSGSQWLQLMELWDGHVRPRTMRHIQALLDSGLCKKANCINIYALPSDLRGTWGRASDPPGAVWVDANRFDEQPNVGAHELGHAFGLTHTPYHWHLMRERPPVGHSLSWDECQQIEDMAPRYPCA